MMNQHLTYKNQPTPLSKNALQVLESRYLRRDEKDKLIETPDEMFRRVAKAVAQAELKYGTDSDVANWEEKFYHLMRGLLFLPNSPTLMNAGLSAGQLSACFVLAVEDSLDAIFTTLKQAALIQQSGGGTGFNFSKLRPQGDLIRSTGGTSSGPVSFMKIFDASTEHIKQGGKRRGANMGMINIDHPDVEAFIQAKTDEKVLRNFNLSVGMRDAFMKAVEEDDNWALIHPVSGKVVKRVKAKRIWQLIVQCAWQRGDPGLVFLDSIQRSNPLSALGEINATNPCGEMPLLPFESCNLGSINLSRMLFREKDRVSIDWEGIARAVEIAVRFLDNVIDINHYFIPQVKEATLGSRKVGLGVMGWAEFLIQLGIPYQSVQALDLGARLMEFINQQSLKASVKLAKTRGPFKHWSKSTYFHQKVMVRNATRTSIAPTGSISIIAHTSSSIEPLFALVFQRENVLNGQRLLEINPLIIEQLQQHYGGNMPLLNKIRLSGNLSEIEEIPEATKKLFRTSLEIPFLYHLKHQRVFQKHTDNAVSKTINLPHEAKVEDVALAYKTAWQMGLKGITIYRYGSRKNQVLTTAVAQEKQPQLVEQSCKVCID
ncbi:ribonucleoside-diphosphate reductase alpha chain [Catalinimonas alkaloidigena]|uniref:adenosylcobalamin-dependent ribonucleoside-diphosphate reductase n=1 Tax=Catalinimonas alkaloidigena TaxID=1075417 RepID=UPI002406A4ED|nr:adenosylcobalamin-dependent ribonucleoside-diphosphate reductase [Catalinimonas alkaloidigena]MDF9797856.1 ribonucleoside-diphosphate reductase alpha chain [Catalinimonas alkaloidigena]